MLPLVKNEQNLSTPRLIIWLEFLTQKSCDDLFYCGSKDVKVFMLLNLNTSTLQIILHVFTFEDEEIAARDRTNPVNSAKSKTREEGKN